MIQISQALTPPAIFVNCKSNCYEDYLKQELTPFSFVRDRLLSDIEILIIEQENSSNGKTFTLDFLGRDKSLTDKRSTVIFSTHAGDSQDMIRQSLIKHIKLGLFKLLIDSEWEQCFDMEIQLKKDSVQNQAKDNWNYWVFSPGIDGYIEGESNFTYSEFKSFLNVRKITKENKFILSGEHINFFRKYVLDSTLSLGVNSIAIKPLYVKSLTRHWSAGMLGNYTLDQYRNIQTGIKLAPVVEYNIFPIEINAKKQLRIAYQAGIQYWNYYVPTIYNLTEETRPFQKLSIITEIVQPWGNISSTLNGSAYLDIFSQNRFSLNVLLSFRLFKGFTLNIEGNASIINDQISLIREKLDDTVYLLNGQQLPTSFNYWTAFGFSYTFGSIHNTIVNPRLGQVD